MTYYPAHSGIDVLPEGQPLKAHLNNVAELAAGFCEPFGAAEDGSQCGFFHDVGKDSEAFQRRMRGSAERIEQSFADAVSVEE